MKLTRSIVYLSISILLIGASAWLWRGKLLHNNRFLKSAFRTEHPINDSAVLKKADLAAVDIPATPIPQLASAWMRLATERSPKARDKAMQYLNDSPKGTRDPRLSQIAIHVLGYFDELASNEKLSELLHSKDPKIRRGAIGALCIASERGSPREQIIRKDVESEKKKNAKEFARSPEALTELSSLYRISKTDSDRAWALTQILELEKDASIAEPQRRLVLNTLLHLAPNDARVQDFAKSSINPKLPTATKTNPHK